jgi:hypothetical protein
MHEESTASAAALSLVEEKSEVTLLNSLVNIGILHDDVG